ncbi:hypothetical protein JCM3766R1_001112 [Sporobolomyces carnicolor]
MHSETTDATRQFEGSLERPSRPFQLYKLPIELISSIYDAIPLHPVRERNSTLASLCRVDHFSLELARPILYRQLEIGVNFRVSSSFYQLARTLKAEGSVCRGRVRVLVVSFLMPTPESLEALYDLLEHLELKEIRTRWIFGGGGWMENETRDQIGKKQPRLERLKHEVSRSDVSWCK